METGVAWLYNLRPLLQNSLDDDLNSPQEASAPVHRARYIRWDFQKSCCDLAGLTMPGKLAIAARGVAGRVINVHERTNEAESHDGCGARTSGDGQLLVGGELA